MARTAMAEAEIEPVSRPAGKSAAAFRTISEVSTELNVPQHVLRFWETKFSQLRPLKRGGGRRYYRPEDVELLRRIHRLLYSEGYTIKGVQRLLRAPKAGAADAGRSADDMDDADGDTEAASGMLVPDLDASAHPEIEHEQRLGLSLRQRQELQDILDELRDLRRLLMD